jgi:hypothetical protein
MTNSEQLSQRVEKEVRYLIGDLHMQILLLRSLVDLSQQPSDQPPGDPARPQPNPTPQEKPPGRPGPSPDLPPPSPNRTPVPDPARGSNGHRLEGTVQ